VNRHEPLTSRGIRICRGCGSESLTSVLDLNEQPIANELLPSADAREERFPLHLSVCTVCGLGQIGEFVLPERIFQNDYPYLSSVSTSWVAHSQSFAERMIGELDLDDSSIVVEVASNDGYLLRCFQQLGIRTLGIEPADNVARIARADGIDTRSIFLGAKVGEEIAAEVGHPRLIVANNVMAHVPDLHDFIAGLAALSGPETIITVENPSFLNLLQKTQFDTIYHEHFSYLSAHAVKRAVTPLGLELVRVEELPTHGGSYRYWIIPQGQGDDDGSVASAIAHERKAGLLSPELWSNFATRTHATLEGLTTWLHERRAAGNRVAAYGAAAKGNTLLNAAGVTADQILLCVDGSFEKQGKYLPGSRIRVAPPEELAGTDPSDVLVLPWNIAPEIAEIVDRLTPDARSWVAVPAMATIGAL
jgi:hypothetical protein